MRPEYRATTLRQLLTHTSGLPENIEDETTLNSLLYDESPASLTERRRVYIARALQDEPVGRAGRFSYSNTGFLIAAFMAETAAKTSYESLMRNEVFKPLGMTSAGFGRPPAGQPAGHMHDRVAVPRDVNPDFFAPAGNIYVSLDDWARFCIDQLQGAAGKGALLKPQTYSVTQSPPPGVPVSMGWFVRDSIAGLPGPVYYHEGSDGAWYAVVALFPASGSGVLAVANAGKDMGGKALTLDAARNAADLLASKK
jgi:CubicO group peptidase (beta-lactamase class C family)